MEGLRTSSVSSIHIATSISKTQFTKPKFLNFQFNPVPTSTFSRKIPSTSKLFTTISSSPSFVSTPEPELEADSQAEKFDWYAHWYPVMPVCDLDKRAPHAKKVMGLDIVVWWDKNESSWRVFNDACPHRMAPLSEGRVDQWGRLQCVYHGWCFNGSGNCNFIPQAPPDGPPVSTSKKACVAVYPSTVHHDIVWFWPNTDPQYKDIILKKQPPFIPELDDPSYIKITGSRDLPYGYEVLIENLMDPAHVPYAHYGIMRTRQPKVKADREGGSPVELSIKKLDIDGFIGNQVQFGINKFIAPCISYADSSPVIDQGDDAIADTEKKPSMQRREALIFFCVPVSPGNSRLIWAIPKNYGVWIAKVPRFIHHSVTNIVLDSDLYLLHLEERKIMEIGASNWQKACFVPAKSDAFVVGFRKWLNKYAGGQVDWRGNYSGTLPPTPPREQLLDRYWSHVVNCPSCNSAYKGLNALEVILQFASLAFIGIAGATKHNAYTMVAMAVVCFVGSKWLDQFIYKNFHYHDYDHAFR
ncbi:protochlorophyllide-dependent translocon component 52, chloroplastic-like [Populus nigra]|uniref:protochlorophyllide-dependent translocon component 52, chloroplastic-like n=1 Tax=Populus nigra TaxID=3691 RepID=UPI002B266BBF|nr:protochlorophyllide-dependent translocon component 52, chloroplastic-like [Populus nigra]